MDGYIERFSGQAKIRVRFRNAGEVYKFYEYILKTKWRPGVPTPQWEEMDLEFNDSDDVANISKTIVQLLQQGFEVYSCDWKMEKQLAEEESPPEDEVEEDGGNDAEGESEEDWLTPEQLMEFLKRVADPFD